MTTDTLTLCKLIILFLLNHVKFSVSNAQISDFILSKDYTNYFVIQQAISQLLETNFISSESTKKTSYYQITSEGKQSIEFFHTKIPAAIKQDILSYLKEKHYQLRRESSVFANYVKKDRSEYTVRFQVKENQSAIIDLSLTVPTEKIAISMCNAWKEKSQEIYAYLFQTLLADQ